MTDVAWAGAESKLWDMHRVSQNFLRRKTPKSSSRPLYRFLSSVRPHHAHERGGACLIGGTQRPLPFQLWTMVWPGGQPISASVSTGVRRRTLDLEEASGEGLLSEGVAVVPEGSGNGADEVVGAIASGRAVAVVSI